MTRAKSPLESLPGIGPSMARDLIDLGYDDPSQLEGQDPETMFEDLCRLRGQKIDRCVLYVFRCAVYCAGTETPAPELTKWWNWKDRSRRRNSDGALR